MNFDVTIVGSGAAGYFAAINIKLRRPDAKVVLLEKTNKTLSKVKVSGGGRCNVTHYQLNSNLMATNYPRGEKFLKQVFKQFNVQNTIDWFQKNGVELVVEADGRMFPKSNSSETIIALFESMAMKLKIDVWTRANVIEIQNMDNEQYRVQLYDGQLIQSQFVVLSSGGINKPEVSDYLSQLNLTFVPSVPSLFSFNIPNSNIKELAGLSVKNGKVKVVGIKKSYQGPLLVTHWGLSGPAILKTSAWFARELNEVGYHFQILVSWINIESEDETVSEFQEILANSPKKQMNNLVVFDLPNRLWQYILQISNVDENKRCMELKKSEMHKIVENLIRMPFEVQGKTTFKDEFVTAGGIDLTTVNPETLEIKSSNNLYAVGEILNIDGVTGGFNFQAAWSTAWVAAMSISGKIN